MWPHAQLETVAAARRAKRATSFGLSCSTTNDCTPVSRIAARNAFQSSTPWPGSAHPSSSRHSPGGAMSLMWQDDDAAGVAPELGRRIGAAARDPGEVGLPERGPALLRTSGRDSSCPSAAFRIPSDDCASRRRDPRRVDDRAELRQLLAERAPFGLAAVAFAERRRRRKDGAHAEIAADRDRRPTSARRRSMPTWQLGAVMPCWSSSALEPRRVGEQAAERLDAPVSEAGEQFELPLERLEHARGIELKRKSVDRLHAMVSRDSEALSGMAGRTG